MPKKNLYTTLQGLNPAPKKHVGDNNIYTALGLKPSKKKKAVPKKKAKSKKKGAVWF